jgi:hypothetical protein
MYLLPKQLDLCNGIPILNTAENQLITETDSKSNTHSSY